MGMSFKFELFFHECDHSALVEIHSPIPGGEFTCPECKEERTVYDAEPRSVIVHEWVVGEPKTPTNPWAERRPGSA